MMHETQRAPRRPAMRLALVAVLALAASVLFAPSAVADELVFKTRWSGGPGPNGGFFYPGALALDSSGNVFVSDFANSRIQVFEPSGNFIRKWGSPGSGEGEFNTNTGIAIDSADNVYVVDQGNARIEVFDSQGAFIRMWGWGVDDGTATLQTCTSGCEPGMAGSGDGQLGFDSKTQGGAGALAVDSADNVYVVDAINNRIQVFDPNGSFIRKWGSVYQGGIAIDSSDQVFIGDEGPLRVHVFDSVGTPIREWGSEGTGAGKFKLYVSLGDVDPSGNVFVTSAERDGNPARESVPGRVEIFDSSDTFVREWGGFPLPSDVAVDGTGNIYVTSQHEVDKYRLIPGPDTAVADPEASASQTQSLKGGIKAKFRSDESVTGVVTGQVGIAGAGKAARASGRGYRLKRQVRQGDPGRGKVVKLKPSKRKHTRKIRKALKKGKKARAKLKVKLTDEAGNKKTTKLKVKLKR